MTGGWLSTIIAAIIPSCAKSLLRPAFRFLLLARRLPFLQLARLLEVDPALILGPRPARLILLAFQRLLFRLAPFAVLLLLELHPALCLGLRPAGDFLIAFQLLLLRPALEAFPILLFLLLLAFVGLAFQVVVHGISVAWIRWKE